MGNFPNLEGRPYKDIDLQLLEKLAYYDNSLRDAANELGLDKDTLLDRMKDPKIRKVWERGKSKGRVDLRQAQQDKALGGDNGMLIWLGKNRLGQSEPSKQPKEEIGLVLRYIESAKSGIIHLNPDGSENELSV